MEAKLINAVITIQRFSRGFLARKVFEKMLSEIYLKVSLNYLLNYPKKKKNKNDNFPNIYFWRLHN